MSEAQRLVQQLEATVGAAVVLEYLSGLDALARDTAYHVEAIRKRDTIDIDVKRITRFKLPKSITS